MKERLPVKPRLDHLRLRDTQAAAARSAAYSRYVGLMRWALPALALCAVAALMIWPYWQAHRISVTMVENVPNLMVEKLNLTGIDTKNQPYSLTAERALQAQNAKELIELDAPKGEITLQDGSWVTGHARQGQLNEPKRLLWLQGEAELIHDKGYRFTSDEIRIDMNESKAWGDQPIVIQGNFGEVYGKGFRFSETDGTMIVTGPARAKLQLHQSAKADKPNVNHSQAR